MSQTRIVLRDKVKKRAEELLAITQLETLSELVTVMISRYGRHLEQTWEVKPTEVSKLTENSLVTKPKNYTG